MDKKKKSNQNWQQLNFSVPITQAVSDNKKDFLIKGIAINSTVTRNGVEFISEELSKSAMSLRNKPILKDHTNTIDSIVGRTTDNVNFNDINENVEFEAKIVDKSIQEKISQGLIQSVSVGAMVGDLEEALDDDGNMTHVIAKGIDFVELSLVAVPADPGAGLATAIMQSFNLKQSNEPKEIVEEISSEKLQEKHLEESKMEDLEKIQKENAELKAKLDKIEMEAKFEAEVAKRVEAKLAETKVESTVEEEQPKEEVVEETVDETKGEVGDTAEDKVEESVEDNIAFEREGKGYTMYMKEYSDKYARLSR